jgi:hypothetical protein
MMEAPFSPRNAGSHLQDYNLAYDSLKVSCFQGKVSGDLMMQPPQLRPP